MQETRSAVFSRIYERNSWGGSSISGPGSSMDATRRIRDWIPTLLRRHGIQSLNDAPCGDGDWISDLRPLLKEYRGFDIVSAIIERNNDKFGLGNFRFQVADIVTDILPKSDAVLCRDCLVHLSFDEGRRAIENFRSSGASFLIATTFARKLNVEQKKPGAWRPLNLEFAPYNLGAPLELFFERLPDANDLNNDKALGLWLLN